ncbi:endonuclease [Loigolactobacillus backii]|nr:HNH endonuclease [Loigolactobacillus backii]MDA5388780.1 HNH endonuclease [Loigolactobacillus backii]MDA5391265.1 HNH endonuclease [Loigolactobacillus backii]PIO83795.1 endonuclease [Loigolactobacillus backii]
MSSPKHYCFHAGCRTLVDYSVKYCSKHKHEYNKQVYHDRMENEGKYQQFYKTTAWKKLSKSFREVNPVCVKCYERGVIRKVEIVDHITPIRDDWSKRLDWHNLQSLCLNCHNIKTKVETESRNKE